MSWKKYTERSVFQVGDWVVDHDEGGQGVITQLGDDNIIIDWRTLGKFATPRHMAEEAVKLGDWEVQNIDLTKLTAPKPTKRLKKIGL